MTSSLARAKWWTLAFAKSPGINNSAFLERLNAKNEREGRKAKRLGHDV
jgi:hypothetical protein